MGYERVVAEAMSAIWAIRPDMMAVMMDILSRRVEGIRLSHDEIKDRIAAKDNAQRSISAPKNVAVLPIRGIISPRINMMSEISGGTSMEKFRSDLAAAVASEKIGSIVLDIDSSGGNVALIEEGVNDIRRARDTKPIFANASTMAASAAYWLGAQASEFSATPSGEVGSIGVYTAHRNIAGALEKEGIKYTLISAGPYKIEGNAMSELSDEAIDYMQLRVDAQYDIFVSDVARGRGVSVEHVLQNFGGGRMIDARDAVKAGMIDRVETLEETIERAANAAASNTPPRKMIGTGFYF